MLGIDTAISFDAYFGEDVIFALTIPSGDVYPFCQLLLLLPESLTSPVSASRRSGIWPPPSRANSCYFHDDEACLVGVPHVTASAAEIPD